MTKKQDRLDNLQLHYNRCEKLFDLGNCSDSKLVKKYRGNGKAISLLLMKLENKLYKHTLGMCNNGDYNKDLWFIDLAIVEEILYVTFPNIVQDIKYNTDARGVVLKIRIEAMINKNYDLSRDMGGYGLLSPFIE